MLPEDICRLIQSEEDNTFEDDIAANFNLQAVPHPQYNLTNIEGIQIEVDPILNRDMEAYKAKISAHYNWQEAKTVYKRTTSDWYPPFGKVQQEFSKALAQQGYYWVKLTWTLWKGGTSSIRASGVDDYCQIWYAPAESLYQIREAWELLEKLDCISTSEVWAVCQSVDMSWMDN